MRNQESSVIGSPLHGDIIQGLGLGTSTAPGPRTLAKRTFATELGLYERVHSRPHSDYPGIQIIETFRAPFVADGILPTLEEAVKNNTHSQRFLLSILDQGRTAIVSSRMGYVYPGRVYVQNVTSDHCLTDPHLKVDMYDSPSMITNPELTAVHLGRLSLKRGDPSKVLSQQAADEAFRRIAMSARSD